LMDMDRSSYGTAAVPCARLPRYRRATLTDLGGLRAFAVV
jgi:hypothetical protein